MAVHILQPVRPTPPPDLTITRRLHEVHEGTAEALTAAGIVQPDQLPGPLHPQERLIRVTYRADGSVLRNGTNKMGRAWQPGARCIEVLSMPDALPRRFRVTVYVDGGIPSSAAPTKRVVGPSTRGAGAGVQVEHPDATARAVASLADACALLRVLAEACEVGLNHKALERHQGACRVALRLLTDALELVDSHLGDHPARMTIYDAAGVVDALDGACFQTMGVPLSEDPGASLAGADVAACARLAARLAGEAAGLLQCDCRPE